MKVRELLRRKGGDVVTVPRGSDIASAVQLLLDHNIGSLPVVDDRGRLMGLVAERDLLSALHLDPNTDEGILIERVMRSPAPVCSPDETIQEAMAQMTRERQRHLVIADGESIMGVISVGDIVKHRLEQLETETGVLRDVVAAQRAARGGVD